MRKTFVKLHLWLGLTLGLLWAVSGLTGAMLLFGKEASRVVGVVGSAGPPAPLEAVIENATKAAGGAFIERLLVKDKHHDLINALYADADGIKHIIVIDAATARPIDKLVWEPRSPVGNSFYRWLYTAHMTYLAGHNGMTLVGVTGLFFISMSLTGLWIGWPRKRSWRAAIAVGRWPNRATRLYGWHRLVGLLVGVFLIGTATTGAFMALPEEPVRQFVAGFADYEPIHAAKASHHKMPIARADPQISIDEAVRLAEARFPGSDWVRLWPPTMHYPFFTVRVLQPGEVRGWLGTTTVVVDARSGRITDIYDARRAPISNKLFDGAFSYHNGELLGLAGRILTMLAGLALPTLYVTGVWTWWRRRKQRQRRELRAAPADGQPLAGRS